MQWIADHIETVLAVVAFLWAAWKAKRSHQLAGFLTQKLEGLATAQDKDAVKSSAIVAGLQGLLHRTVVNQGLSSDKEPTLVSRLLHAVLPLFLIAAVLGGCCSADVKARDDALRGVLQTHDAMDPDCLTPNPTPGQKALIDAARQERLAGHRLVDPK